MYIWCIFPFFSFFVFFSRSSISLKIALKTSIHLILLQKIHWKLRGQHMRFDHCPSNPSNLDMLRHSGPMVNILVSRLNNLGLSPCQGWVSVVFFGKALYSQSASLRPGVQMGTSKFNAGGNPAMEQHPIQGGVEILLVASCYWNQRKAPTWWVTWLVCRVNLTSNLDINMTSPCNQAIKRYTCSTVISKSTIVQICS